MNSILYMKPLGPVCLVCVASNYSLFCVDNIEYPSESKNIEYMHFNIITLSISAFANLNLLKPSYFFTESTEANAINHHKTNDGVKWRDLTAATIA
jgi:hypothetical protein